MSDPDHPLHLYTPFLSCGDQMWATQQSAHLGNFHTLIQGILHQPSGCIMG